MGGLLPRFGLDHDFTATAGPGPGERWQPPPRHPNAPPSLADKLSILQAQQREAQLFKLINAMRKAQGSPPIPEGDTPPPPEIRLRDPILNDTTGRGDGSSTGSIPPGTIPPGTDDVPDPRFPNPLTAGMGGLDLGFDFTTAASERPDRPRRNPGPGIPGPPFPPWNPRPDPPPPRGPRNDEPDILDWIFGNPNAPPGPTRPNPTPAPPPPPPRPLGASGSLWPDFGGVRTSGPGPGGDRDRRDPRNTEPTRGMGLYDDPGFMGPPEPAPDYRREGPYPWNPPPPSGPRPNPTPAPPPPPPRPARPWGGSEGLFPGQGPGISPGSSLAAPGSLWPDFGAPPSPTPRPAPPPGPYPAPSPSPYPDPNEPRGDGEGSRRGPGGRWWF